MTDYDLFNPFFTNQLETIDAEELMARPFAPRNYLVAGLVPQGLTLLCGPSKAGKSWLVLQLCLCVALGVRFLGYNTLKSDVLYLALEDTFARVKERIAKLTDDHPTNLRFAVEAGTLGDGLEEQLRTHITQYPNTRLVVIDTLQKVRGQTVSKSSSPTYGKDYTDIGALKKLADMLGIAIVVVHHLRKTKDKEDPFNEISGTTGLIGAADTTLLLKRFDRTSEYATLLWTGRDTDDGSITLSFYQCIWETADGNQQNVRSCYRPLHPIIEKVCDYIEEHKYFRGTASELLTLLCDTEVKPNVLTRNLSSEAYDWLQHKGILYNSGRTGNGRWIELSLKPSDDHDANDAENTSENLPSQPSLTVTMQE